jgi:hypothetical protein
MTPRLIRRVRSMADMVVTNRRHPRDTMATSRHHPTLRPRRPTGLIRRVATNAMERNPHPNKDPVIIPLVRREEF